MNIKEINKERDKVAAFFEWWTEWAAKYDEMRCVFEDEKTGSKTFAVYDMTGHEKCRFNTEQGMLVIDGEEFINQSKHMYI